MNALLRRLGALLSPTPVPKRVHLAVDLPEDGASSSGSLVIHGWAFSHAGEIVQVQARLGNSQPVALRLGVRRPDVARAYDKPDAESCGFEGLLTFQSNVSRSEQLVVSATDALGEAAEVSVPIRVLPRPAHRPVGKMGGNDVDQAGALSAPTPALSRRVQAVASEARDRLGREPAFLDLDSGLHMAAKFPALAVVRPPKPDVTTQPYLDRSIDVVVVNAQDPIRLQEARRIARSAVLDSKTMALSWLPDVPKPPVVPTVSVIIPAHNEVEHTGRCLTQVMATLPSGFRGEILVVDDASTDDTPAVLEQWRTREPAIRVIRNDVNEGFLRSCNRGADVATGEILVFLNNDTLPQHGWLSPLVRQVSGDPTIGAVGGKLLYPDGTLQEAGGVIFSDASGCNFGKHDPNPTGPLYDVVRDVDYCSGALLAIRRRVFFDVGRFDEAFCPAYYEDTDLCFRLRDRGYRVVYEPASVVIHVEGASSGTDTSAGVKRFQLVNLDKFRTRWQSRLAEQSAPPAKMDAAARHALFVRDKRPRALVAAPRLPEYDRESGSRRVFDLVEFLRRDGWAVSVLALDGTAGDRYVKHLQQRGVAVFTGLGGGADDGVYCTDPDALIAHGRFDLAVLAFWDAAEKVLPRLRLLSPSTRVVVDSVDLHFLRSARQLLRDQGPSGTPALDGGYADRMVRELNTYVAADAVMTVSRKEADLVNDITGRPSLAHHVPDVEAISSSPFSRAERNGLLFIGNFRHAPNLEGLTYLCEEILPRLDPALLAQHPLRIVGNECDARVHAVAQNCQNVQVVGWVPELRPYLERSSLSLIPLLHGAGTKRKLIQALMTGTPSVSTSIGIEGLDLQDGVHALVSDSPAEFAAHIERLMTDDMLWNRLASAGRAHAVERHGWDEVHARFRPVLWPGSH